jgi:phosphomevalonate kinase
MITDKLKELNNLLNQKIDDVNNKNYSNSGKNNSKNSNSYNNLKNEIDDVERKILEEKLFQLEKKAFQYIANNNFNIKKDIKTLRRLLRYIERTHEGYRSCECMVERVENLLESVIKKD